MKIAVQMDHVSKLSIKGDTTLALCLEAQKRKFKLYQYLPDNLTFIDGRLKVVVEELKLFDDCEDFFELGKPFTCLLYTSPSPRDRQKSRMPSSA